ncbi:MAG TPA: hypothetical protein PKK06_15210 [Phycisphaerae bacterium]|nr:hypothetical protein [Phycisphaerae bacterium]HNU46688.1 hypothetical protein [Phycisphaerae bacterium]
MIINIGDYFSTPLSPAGRTSAELGNRARVGTRAAQGVRGSQHWPQLAVDSSLQQARQAAIRAEIQNGTYETLERLNGTVDRLLDVLA